MSFILSICMDTFLSYNSQDLSFCLKSKSNLKNVYTDTHNFKNLQTTLQCSTTGCTASLCRCLGLILHGNSDLFPYITLIIPICQMLSATFCNIIKNLRVLPLIKFQTTFSIISHHSRDGWKYIYIYIYKDPNKAYLWDYNNSYNLNELWWIVIPLTVQPLPASHP